MQIIVAVPPTLMTTIIAGQPLLRATFQAGADRHAALRQPKVRRLAPHGYPN
jgi:hypothetical protein